MIVLAPTVMRIPRDQLAEQVRKRFGGELRRTGTFAQVCMLGATACLEAAPRSASLGVLWTSAYGAREATRAALAEAASGEPVMPFTFVATQPHLMATLLAQRGAPVRRAAFVHVARWPMLLGLAQAWVATCDAVLLGWAEEAAAASEHQSDWCVLHGKPGPVPAELPATFAEWLAAGRGATSA